MKLRLVRLRLADFRNFTSESVQLGPGVNIFFGPNGAGKTNLLEAVTVLARGRSHRAARDREVVRWGAAAYRAAAELDADGSPRLVEVAFTGERRAWVNGNLVPYPADPGGMPPVVMFTPDDLYLVRGGPVARRRYLDVALAQLSPAYRHHWLRHRGALIQRNALLRRATGGRGAGRSHIDALDAFDDQVARAGAELLARRAAAVARLARHAAAAHAALAGGERLALRYRPGVPGFDPERDPGLDAAQRALAAGLREGRAADLRHGITGCGPQRDEIAIAIGDREARLYASQGQQRTAALALRLAELALVREERDEPPVLLLDDVMSELDETRRKALAELLGGGLQTLITAAHAGDVVGAAGPEAAWFEVREGKVSLR